MARATPNSSSQGNCLSTLAGRSELMEAPKGATDQRTADSMLLGVRHLLHLLPHMCLSRSARQNPSHHPRANLHFARLDEVEEGSAEPQAWAIVPFPHTCPGSPLSLLIPEVTSSVPLGWASRLPFPWPPSSGLKWDAPWPPSPLSLLPSPAGHPVLGWPCVKLRIY